MRCSNCGEPIEEGRLFCLNCGQEVQWVPDYDSFGDYMVQEKLKKDKEKSEAAAADAQRRQHGKDGKKNRQQPPRPESGQRSQLRTAVEKKRRRNG